MLASVAVRDNAGPSAGRALFIDAQTPAL
jgi:hypothetical protein